VDREIWGKAKQNFGAEPLWFKVYFLVVGLVGLAAPILVVAGVVLPGLILFGLFLLNSAIVLPLQMAIDEKRERNTRRGEGT
jgi:hypothetical protein